MAFVHCPNGHIYDDNKNSICPFCQSSETSETVLNDSDRTDVNSNETWDSQKTMIDENINIENEETVPNDFYQQGDDERTVAMEFPDDVPQATAQVSSADRKKRKLEGFLVSYELNDYGDFFPLYLGKNSIGRNPKNDIVINAPSVSTEHAMILFRGSKILMDDKLSVNGTFVNQQQESIERVSLKDNDLIRFGTILCKIKIIGNIE